MTNRVGEVFGQLVVIAEGPRRRDPCGHSAQLMRVRCACGAELLVRLGNLPAGHTRSCGCLARALASTRMAARRRAQRDTSTA